MAAKNDSRALIICLHHSAYSADINHGSSIHMQGLLNDAFTETGVYPAAVFSGHVHNYQRFTKHYPNGNTVPFVIAGAGGYADLHHVARPGDPAFPDDSPLLDGVVLEKYCDTAHGFLKISVEKTHEKISLTTEYYILDLLSVNHSGIKLFDRFTVDAGRKQPQSE
jgi:hypothetical protein